MDRRRVGMTEPTMPPEEASLGEQLEAIIEQLPEDSITLGELLDVFGDEGLLLLTALLTLVFLVPVAVPGVSTVFGGAILLIGLSRLSARPLWLPRRLRQKGLPAARLRPALAGGMAWVARLDRISRPHRLALLVDGRAARTFVNLTFIAAALLLMAPFGLIPFSNTLPGIALLCYAIGSIQRDGVAVLLGHLATVATVVYFGALLAGGGLAIRELFQQISGS
jgi:hypothetical protein